MAQPRMSEQLYMTQVTETYVEDKLSKKIILAVPIWRPLKISPSKVEKPTYGTKLYHHANFHADQHSHLSSGKNTYFSLYMLYI